MVELCSEAPLYVFSVFSAVSFEQGTSKPNAISTSRLSNVIRGETDELKNRG
jgi:hypothetical protein